MAELYSCAQGHQWDPSASGEAGAALSSCPICGSAATQRTPTDGIAIDSGGETLPSAEAVARATILDRGAVPGYEIIERIATGGMSIVYKARQLSLNRVVALKVIVSGVHATRPQLNRFRSEAETLARMQHPNVVQIYEVGQAGEPPIPFFAMEYVDGGSLAQHIAEYALRSVALQKLETPTPFTPPPSGILRTVQVVETLARAMHYAHQRGIIHRDLKPANVLFTADGTPKVVDFGLAKQLQAEVSQTQSGTILGTPHYMPPEQATGRNRDIGPATDVYSLGAILYELLTGRPPFQGETVLDTIEQVRSHDPTPPRELNSGVPRDLETICLKCLQKDPRRRYSSMAALADDLRRFQAGESIHARPSGVIERIGRWARRRREVALVLVGVALTVVLGFVLSGLKNWGTSEPSQPVGTEPVVQKPALPADLNMVPRDAIGFISLRFADLVRSEGIKRLLKRVGTEDPNLAPQIAAWEATFEEATGLKPATIERVTATMVEVRDLPSKSFVTVVKTSEPYDRNKVLKALVPGAREERSQDRVYYAEPKPDGLSVWPVTERVLVIGSPVEVLPRFLNRVTAAPSSGALDSALQLANSQHHLTIGLNPQFVGLLLNQSGLLSDPEELEAVLPLLELQSASMKVDLQAAPQAGGDQESVQLELLLTFADDARAEGGRKAAEVGLRLLQQQLRSFIGKTPEGLRWMEVIATALASAKVQRQAREVRVVMQLQPDLGVLGRAAAQMQGLLAAARRLQSIEKLPGPPVVDMAFRLFKGAITPGQPVVINNLSKLGTGLHSYHQTHGSLPPAAITDKAGKPLLSWRVAILPYIEELDLYKQFKLDEPWDSPHNLKLLEKMPKLYGPVLVPQKAPFVTYYQAFVGKTTMWEEGRKITFAEVTSLDGNAQTILLAEAKTAVPWTKPADLSYEAGKPLPPLGGLSKGEGFHVLFADGRPKLIPKRADEALIRALITRNGGEAIDPSKLP